MGNHNMKPTLLFSLICTLALTPQINDFIVGFSNAMMHKDITTDVRNCLTQFQTEQDDISQVLADLKHMNLPGIEQALHDLIYAYYDLSTVLDKCEDTNGDDPAHADSNIDDLKAKLATIVTELIQFDQIVRTFTRTCKINV